VDRKHWLVWTTRKHILARALKEMDLTGRASDFPSPAELTVTADGLTVEEKALILYRHARASSLDDTARRIVKDNCADIVRDDHFTPERIRRFVTERLPELCTSGTSRGFSDEELKAEVKEAIRNPTKRMQTAFRRLPEDHKWILIALLESENSAATNSVKSTFDSHRATTSDASFAEGLDDLTGTFIKVARRAGSADQYIDWIHPSYRDLVIDELARDLEMQVDFLRAASIQGIKLALSQGGGSGGTRSLPFLGRDTCWRALTERCLSLAANGDEECLVGVLRAIVEAVSVQSSGSSVRGRLASTLRAVCDTVFESCVSSTSASLTYLDAARLLDPPPRLLDLTALWRSESVALGDSFDPTSVLDPDIVKTWVLVTNALLEFDPGILETADTRVELRRLYEGLLSAIEYDVEGEACFEKPSHATDEADRLGSISRSIEILSELPCTNREMEEKVLSDLWSKEEQYREEGRAGDGDHYDYLRDDDDERRSSFSAFDIDGLFDDL